MSDKLEPISYAGFYKGIFGDLANQIRGHSRVMFKE